MTFERKRLYVSWLATLGGWGCAFIMNWAFWAIGKTFNPFIPVCKVSAVVIL